MKTTFPSPSIVTAPVDRDRQAISGAVGDARLRRDSEAGPRQRGDIREQSAHFFAAPQDFSIEPWPHGGRSESEIRRTPGGRFNAGGIIVVTS
jgi:hypothetical protein